MFGNAFSRACAGVVILLVSAIVSAVEYDLIDLGSGSSGLTYPKAINYSGVIVGMSIAPLPPFGMHPYRWQDGQLLDLGTFGGDQGAASSINTAGKIVGGADLLAGRHRAFLWTEKTGLQNLGVIAGHDHSAAYGLNDWDLVVGTSFTQGPFNAARGFLWYADEVYPLDHLPGYTMSWSVAVNNWGQSVGRSSNALTTVGARAVMWDWTTPTELLGLTENEGAVANAINDYSQVVGMAFISPTNALACLWYDGKVYNLDTLSDLNSAAYGINHLGQIVGDFFTGGERRAFLWQDGKMQDLNNFLPPGSEDWLLVHARSINDAGQIVGEAFVTGRGRRGFLLTPRQ